MIFYLQISYCIERSLIASMHSNQCQYQNTYILLHTHTHTHVNSIHIWGIFFFIFFCSSLSIFFFVCRESHFIFINLAKMYRELAKRKNWRKKSVYIQEYFIVCTHSHDLKDMDFGFYFKYKTNKLKVVLFYMRNILTFFFFVLFIFAVFIYSLSLSIIFSISLTLCMCLTISAKEKANEKWN